MIICEKMEQIKKLFEIGWINTFRLNLHYFGIGGVLRPRIIAARNLRINLLKGNVAVTEDRIGAVRIGFGHIGIIDNKYQRSLWENSGTIIFDGDTHIGPGVRIVNSGTLRFGNSFCITAASDIICYQSITFGENVLISWDCLFMDTDIHKIMTVKGHRCTNEDRPIVIGDNVWISCRSVVLKGSAVPDNSVIAAGSVICKQYSESNAVYGSNRMLKNEIMWEV